MPELPEVETIRRDLEKLIVGKTILDIKTDSPKQVKPFLAKLKKEVIGTSIKKIDRKAKLLLLKLSKEKTLGVHLKLTGRLLVRKTGEPKDKWQHVVIILSGGKELRFADLRKFGWIKLINKDDLGKLKNEFGPEPLADLTLSKFEEILGTTSRAIKILLMDQKKIAGIGNIYACDALNLAEVDPKRAANKLTKKETKKLFEAVNKVLKAGIKYRGASDQFYLDALGHKGKYQEHFLVYGRKGKKCFNCKGEVVRIALGGRGTFFCPNCQK